MYLNVIGTCLRFVIKLQDFSLLFVVFHFIQLIKFQVSYFQLFIHHKIIIKLTFLLTIFNIPIL